MTSISSVSSAPIRSAAPSPMDDERRRLSEMAKGGDPGPNAGMVSSYMPVLGGYGGGSAFAAQVIGGGGSTGGDMSPGGGLIGGNPGTALPEDGGIGGGAPIGGGGGGGGAPGTAVTYTMQSGDGFDLFTGSVLPGAGEFGGAGGLAGGDFQLSSDGNGGVQISLGAGMGLPNQIAIQRGTALGDVASAEGASYGDGSSPQSIGAGDTAIIDFGGFANYAIGNVRQGQDGSISFDVKEIPATSQPAVDPMEATMSAMNATPPTMEQAAIADSSPDASPEAQAAASAMMAAQQAATAYAATMAMATVSGGEVNASGGVSSGGGGGGGGTSSGGGGASAGSSGATSASTSSASTGSSGGGASAATSA